MNKTLAAAGAAIAIMAGAATLALWPSQATQPAPDGSVLSQGAVEVCDQSDGGDGTCRIC